MLQVGWRVDVVRAAGVAALDQRDELGASAQVTAGSLAGLFGSLVTSTAFAMLEARAGIKVIVTP